MMDKDLAEMYSVETKSSVEQVQRDPIRFPMEFMFRPTDEEFEVLTSQFATSNKGWGSFSKLLFSVYN